MFDMEDYWGDSYLRIKWGWWQLYGTAIIGFARKVIVEGLQLLLNSRYVMYQRGSSRKFESIATSKPNEPMDAC